MSGEYVSTTQEMRNIALTKAEQGNFDVDSKKWFEMQTGKINLLKEVEDKLSNDLLAISEEIGAQASAAVVIGISIIVIVFSIAIFSVIAIARSILTPLNNSVQLALRMADGDMNVEIEVDRKMNLVSCYLRCKQWPQNYRRSLVKFVVLQITFPVLRKKFQPRHRV